MNIKPLSNWENIDHYLNHFSSYNKIRRIIKKLRVNSVVICTKLMSSPWVNYL